MSRKRSSLSSVSKKAAEMRKLRAMETSEQKEHHREQARNRYMLRGKDRRAAESPQKTEYRREQARKRFSQRGKYRRAAVKLAFAMTINKAQDVDGGTPVIIKNELIIKDELITEDLEIVRDEVASTLQTYQPQVEEEADPLHADGLFEDIYISNVIIKEEPMTADDKSSSVVSEADQSATQTEPDSSISREKRYLCDTCGYRAGYLCHLKVHVRIHTGEKPHACDTCDYRTG